MRYIMTIIWSLLIGSAVAFVLSSMANEAFVLSKGLLVGLVFAAIVILLGEGVLKENTQE